MKIENLNEELKEHNYTMAIFDILKYSGYVERNKEGYYIRSEKEWQKHNKKNHK